MSDVKAGSHKAKIIDYGLRAGSDGKKPSVQIVLKGEDFTLSWFGQLETEKNQEFTAKTLFACGCTKSMATPADWQAFNEGAGSGFLDESKELDVTVAIEEYKGKMYTKIKWINEPGFGMMREKLASADLVTQMAGINLGAQMVEAKTNAPKKSEVKNHAPGFDSEEKIPF